ncbi:MAG: transcription elongation factor GreA [Treponema bryantii]|nr:transcription elongation factor GreA [Treponema bryantii]
MAEGLVESVQSMLKEETWTRATISNYTQNNLKELANIVEQAKNENVVDEIQQICEEHLLHSKDSIIALYLSGIFALQKGSLDNTQLINLVDIFQKNHKEAIVIYLCESILEDDPNNIFALRVLANQYKKNDKVWDLYKKIIKIDFTEADLVKALAEHYEGAKQENADGTEVEVSESSDEKNIDLAIEYYQKALLRYINAGNYNAVKEIWAKLLQFIPEKIDFFQLAKRRIAKTLGENKTTDLMQDLCDYYRTNQLWDTAISILKQNLEIDPKDNRARKEIVECYRGKYANHSHLEEYIKSSNLTQNYRNVFEAITDFEKHIAFDKGNFVFHNSWGVGIITKLANDKLEINFGKAKGSHEISLKLAINTLKPLAKDHIWVLKATTTRDKLVEKIESDKKWTLNTIIKSFDNNCDFKRIKAEISPLLGSKWTSWSSAAKKILETEPTFGINPNDINMYTVRDTEISPEEKLKNEFTAQKQFFARVDILMKYFDNELTDNSNEFFTDMYSYFTGILKNITHVNEQTIAAYLVVKSISTIDKQFAFPIKESFAELYSRIEDPRQLYENLKDTKNTSLRKDFINCVKMLPNWNEEYIKLFPIVLDVTMLENLVDSNFTEDVQKLVCKSFEMYKDYRETVLFFFKECQEKEWFKNAGVPYEKQLITLINIIELTFREINSHVNSTENKKINKNATLLLFKDNTIFDYMFKNNEDTVMKLYTLIDDITDLDPTYKELTRAKILEKYPNVKFRVSEEKTKQSNGMLVTAAKLQEKKAEIERIRTVEIPKNNDDINDAKAKGDLKENQEYKSAKEKQHILNLELSKLTSELARAIVFDPTTATTSVISFGNTVTLTNNTSGKDETYTILGPWESDPENKIISYMSPLGNAFLEKKVGESFKVTINDNKYDYTVKAIKKADL